MSDEDKSAGVTTITTTIIGVVLAGAIAFLYSEVWSLRKDVTRILSIVEHGERNLDQREKVMRLEIKGQMLELKGQVMAIDAHLAEIQAYQKQIWPRLRRQDKAIEMINDKLPDPIDIPVLDEF